MRKNLGVVLEGEERVKLKERSVRAPAPHEALIEVRAAGICGSDLHMAKFTEDENLRYRVPGVFAGHEGAGRVLVAPEGASLKEGDNVLLYHYEACWECESCQRGYLQWCPRRQALSMDLDGALARYVIVDGRNCLVLPDDFSLADGACIACTAGTAAAAILKLGPELPARALVVGLGPLGAASAQLLSGLGCEVVAVDPIAGRRAFALQKGIVSEAHGSWRGDPIFSAVIETSGVTPARESAVMAAANGGTIVLVGMGEDDSTLPVKHAILAELRMIGSNIWPISSYREILDLYRRADARPSEVVSSEFPLSEGVQAFERARTSPGKLLISPTDESGLRG